MKNQDLKTAIHDYFKAFRRLKELGVVINKKDFTSQIGEWFVQEVYGGKRAEKGNQKYWDIETNIGKIQVKTHSKAKTTKARWSAIKYDLDAEVDFVVIVVFSEDYQLKEFYMVPWQNCLTLIRRNKDRDVLMWDHVQEEFKPEISQLSNQEAVSIFLTNSK